MIRPVRFVNNSKRDIMQIVNIIDDIISTIKILIYKENPLLLDKIDFNNEDVFLDPLLFSYFNNKNLFPKEVLEEILQGYFMAKKPLKIEFSYNKKDVAYIPNKGYFKKGEKICYNPIAFIRNTKIEILTHPICLLEPIFKSASNNKINESNFVIDKTLLDKNIGFLTKAFQLIKESSPQHFKLIEKCCKKCIMFKTDPENTNSFATIQAHGIAFLNVYQDDYDEVFFVDDIAHQTGHIILTTLFFNTKNIYKIDETQTIERLLKENDNRTIHIILHALYTYYTSFLCLDNCITQNLFNEESKKEAISRIGFYLRRCEYDINIFEKIIDHFGSIEYILTIEGIEIYSLIKTKYLEIINKWDSKITNFNYSNQPYNFTYKNFKILNE